MFILSSGSVSRRSSSIPTPPVAIGMKIFHIASRTDSLSVFELVNTIFPEYLLKNPVCLIDLVIASKYTIPEVLQSM